MSSTIHLFPQLVFHQVAARPMGGIPASAKGIPYPTTIQNDWLPSLAPQELACFKLRLSQLTAIFGDKQEASLSTEQREVLVEIYELSQGISNAQINPLKILFSLLALDRGAFTFQAGKKKSDLSNQINQLNVMLAKIFSTIQKILKQKGALEAKNFDYLLSQLNDFFEQITHEMVRDPALFKLQKRALALLKSCARDPNNLFPLLLRPLDRFEAAVRPGGVLRTASWTTSKRAILLGAVTLFEAGLGEYQSEIEKHMDVVEKALKHPRLKGYNFATTSIKTELAAFIKGLREKLLALDLSRVSKQMLALEAKAQKGDITAVKELHAQLRALRAAFQEIKVYYSTNTVLNKMDQYETTFSQAVTSAKSSQRKLLSKAFSIFQALPSLYNFLIQDTQGLFAIMEVGCLASFKTDLDSTVAFMEMAKTRLPQTSSLFIRPVDALIQSSLSSLATAANTATAPEGDREKRAAALNTIASLGLDLILGIEHLAGSGVNGWTDALTKNIADLILEAQAELTQLGINPGLLDELATLGESQAKHGAFSGIPHLYPLLNQPIGKSPTLDANALVFLREAIKFNQYLLQGFPQLIQLCELFLEDKTSTEKIGAFVSELSALLELPCETKNEARALSLKLYQHFQTHYPTPPVKVLEEYVTNIPTLASKLLTALNLFTALHLRVFLEIGLYESLTGDSAPPRTTRTRAPRKASPAPTTTPKPTPAPAETKKVEVAPEALLHPVEAVGMIKHNVQKLPKSTGSAQTQTDLYRNREMEASAQNLEMHLARMAEIFSTSLTPRVFCDTLGRETALSLESALNYLIARHGLELPEDRCLFQHQLDVMAEMVPDLDLDLSEQDFLSKISIMVSHGSRPDQHLDHPLIDALLFEPSASQATEDAIQALELVQKWLGKEPLPSIERAEPALLPEEAVVEVSPCLTLVETLARWHQQTLPNARVAFMHPIHHAMLRSQQMEHMLEDLSYHLSIIESLNREEALPPSMMNGLFHHLGLLMEKSLKVCHLYQAIPSQDNPGLHIAFEQIKGRPRLYDHDLVRNLELVDEVELTEDEREAVVALSDHATFTRYPAGQKGTLPELLDRAALLSEIAEGFFHEDLISKAQKLFGPGSHNEWAAKAQEALERLHTEELAPFVQTALSASEKLLKHAHTLRQ